MNLGTKIYEYRKKAGLSQEELGFKLNVTRQSVSLWENNQAQPTLENLKSLSKIFNIFISELCGESCEWYEKNENINQPNFNASVNYTKEIYVNAYRSLYKKHIIINSVAIIFCSLILFGIIFSNTNKSFIIIPLLLIVVFASYILRINNQIKKLSQNQITLNPNLKVKYSFFKDYFIMESNSDNSNSTYNKKYYEIKTKTQDDNFIYLIFDGFFTVIDKKTCMGNLDKLLQLLTMKKEDRNTNKKTKRLLLIVFILSLVSIYVALVIVVISIGLSPLPEFPLVMVEHMWKFFLITPIPLVSVVLGFIYLKKGYKCLKNIIAGVIMTALLCIFGLFTSIFSSQISHDMNYVNEISSMINFDIPTDGYVSICTGFQKEDDSLAMIKINDENNFLSQIENYNNWKKDTSFIPSNKLDLYLLTLTTSYDYFMIYNLNTNDYNSNFENEFIYLAYDIETSVLLIYLYSID
jgi:hypothetical protein